MEGNKIQVSSISIKVNCRFVGIKELIDISNIDDCKEFSYLSQFPNISNENKDKIKEVIQNNFLFQNLGKMNFYIADVNNRGGDYSFNCFYFNPSKELYYTKFSEEGFFNQVKIK